MLLGAPPTTWVWLDFLINAMWFSGCLRSSQDGVMREVVEGSLHMSVRPAELLQYCLSLLAQPGSIPSSSTMYRHRLTLDLGYWRWLAHLNETLAEGGFLRYGTLDSSPQGGIDLLLFGSTLVPLTELRRAFGLANSLCQQLDEVDERRIVQDLS